MKIPSEKPAGFTRVDLVAVITIIALLGGLTMPLRGDAESESSTIVCRTNKRQMMRAMHLYTIDNDGLFPPNGGDQTPGRTWISTYIDNFGTGATNTGSLSNPTTSLLANYVERNSRAFKCPADPSTVVAAGGKRLPRARSISMNNAVGTDPSSPKNPVPGVWLSGGFGHVANSIWRCYGKMSDIVRPAPSDLFVFIDEHADSINDGMFGSVGPGPRSEKRWIDWPAAYHNGGAGFAMADGSALIHKWLAPASNLTVVNPQPPPLAASMTDLLWLADRTSSQIIDQP